MNKSNKIVVTIFMVALAFSLGTMQLAADEDGSSPVRTSTSLTVQITTLPEAKLIFTQGFTIPFLTGDHALFQGNNIRLNLSTELAPVMMNFKSEAILTPVAFLQFNAGGMIGSGWNMELFGSPVRGIGLNVPDADGNTSANGSRFDSMHTRGHFGGAFQFDMAAIFPGDWNHVVIRTYHELNYMSYGRAGSGDSWFFENDAGENRNGWTYRSNFILGYQMPIFLNMVALQAETFNYLYAQDEAKSWGGDLNRWEFSLLLNFAITQQFGASVATQFRTLRNFTNYKHGDEDNLHYRARILDNNDARSLHFYRVALIMTYRLR